MSTTIYPINESMPKDDIPILFNYKENKQSELILPEPIQPEQIQPELIQPELILNTYLYQNYGLYTIFKIHVMFCLLRCCFLVCNTKYNKIRNKIETQISQYDLECGILNIPSKTPFIIVCIQIPCILLCEFLIISTSFFMMGCN